MTQVRARTARGRRGAARSAPAVAAPVPVVVPPGRADRPDPGGRGRRAAQAGPSRHRAGRRAPSWPRRCWWRWSSRRESASGSGRAAPACWASGQPGVPPVPSRPRRSGRQPRGRADDLGRVAGDARFPARGDSPTRTGLDGRPVPVEQDGSVRPVLLLMAEQLAEPFQVRG